MEASKDMDRVIDVLMLAGTLLLESGSEIHRVEDTMIRLSDASRYFLFNRKCQYHADEADPADQLQYREGL